MFYDKLTLKQYFRWLTQQTLTEYHIVGAHWDRIEDFFVRTEFQGSDSKYSSPCTFQLGLWNREKTSAEDLKIHTYTFSTKRSEKYLGERL